MSKGKLCISHIVLIFASFLSVFPLYYMVCGATNQSIDVVRGKLFPGTYLVENFKALIANQNLGLAMINSFRNAILMRLSHYWSVQLQVMDLKFIMIREKTY